METSCYEYFHIQKKDLVRNFYVILNKIVLFLNSIRNKTNLDIVFSREIEFLYLAQNTFTFLKPRLLDFPVLLSLHHKTHKCPERKLIPESKNDYAKTQITIGRVGR